MADSHTKMGATTLDLKKNSSSSSSFGTTRRSMVCAYCFTLVFVACTIIFVFHPPSNYRSSSIWFTNTPSHFTILSHFFPNTTSSVSVSSRDSIRRSRDFRFPFSRENPEFSWKPNGTSLIGGNNSSPSVFEANSSVNESVVGTLNGPTKEASENSHATSSRRKYGFSGKTNSSPNGGTNKPSFSENQALSLNGPVKGYYNSDKSLVNQSHSVPSPNIKGSNSNSTRKNLILNSSPESGKNASIKGVRETNTMSNHTAVPKKRSDTTNGSSMAGQMQMQRRRQRKENYWLQLLSNCDIFDGIWEKDDSYPLYAAGSCPHIDEPFDCFLNGRPDSGYEKLRWQPNGCSIPRLNGKNMLELLRGKRLVYVGDSLNRNMWESMVCTLRNSVKDPSKVFEASGRQEYRTEGSYSFLFTDYNCSVEFFRSSFLVREWEMMDTNGLKKETLRLDLVDSSSDRYRSADILVFNTGHWWTHEKTSQGKGYYQEGSHVYDELNVIEAFRKAMTTWGRWIDANINPMKTLVFFRGYSASHFSGGQWNSGGQCHNETLPIKNEAYLSQYPPIMNMLERVMKGMKTHVFYLNVTKMTDFRKDAHPSIYRKKNLTEEERRSPLRFQDCSHWCLPGVPDTWNELLYAQLFLKHNQKQQLQQQKQQQQRRNR